MSALIKSQMKHYLRYPFWTPRLACLLKIRAQSQNECGSKSEINKEKKVKETERESKREKRAEQAEWKKKDCQVYALCDAHKAAHPHFAGFLSDIWHFENVMHFFAHLFNKMA